MGDPGLNPGSLEPILIVSYSVDPEALLGIDNASRESLSVVAPSKAAE